MPTAKMTYTIEDADGETFPIHVNVYISNLVTAQEIFTDQAERLWDVIRPLITGVLTDIAVTLDYNENLDGMTNNTVDVLSDVQEKAKLTFRIDGAPLPARLTLPTIDEGFFTQSGAGKILDLTDADVTAFVTAITA